jgi:hypothetical protein
MLPTRLDTTAIFGDDDLRILGSRACVSKSGPNVFTEKVFCSADNETVVRVSSEGGDMTPATCRRRSMDFCWDMELTKEVIESPEEMSSW